MEALCNRLGEVTRRVVHLGRDVKGMRKGAAHLVAQQQRRRRDAGEEA